MSMSKSNPCLRRRNQHSRGSEKINRKGKQLELRETDLLATISDQMSPSLYGTVSNVGAIILPVVMWPTGFGSWNATRGKDCPAVRRAQRSEPATTSAHPRRTNACPEICPSSGSPHGSSRIRLEHLISSGLFACPARDSLTRPVLAQVITKVGQREVLQRGGTSVIGLAVHATRPASGI
jgi:hypothetical protein